MKLLRRAANVGDLQLLYEIHRAALKEHVVRTFGQYDEGFQRENFEKTTDLGTHQLFFDGAAPVGFWSVTRSSKTVTIQRIAVVPAYQNRGIGSSLIRELIDVARAAGRRLELQVFATNRARRLYERLGFRVVRASATHFEMELGGLPLDVVSLAARPKAAPGIARFWCEEWGLPRDCSSLTEYAAKLSASAARNKLPIHVLALSENEVVGAATLKARSRGFRGSEVRFRAAGCSYEQPCASLSWWIRPRPSGSSPLHCC